MSKFLTAPQWYDAGGGLNKSLDVNCNGSDTATAFGRGANVYPLPQGGGVAIGVEASTVGGISIGYKAETEFGSTSIAIGDYATANYPQSCIAIGYKAECYTESVPYRKIQFFSRDEPIECKAYLIGFGGKTLLDLIYPVGSIYISVSSTDPGTIFGGTWEAFATGKTLVGVDSNDDDFKVVENEGGSKTVTLTKDQMPAHTHTLTRSKTGGQTYTDTVFDSVDGPYESVSTLSAGGGQSHNNMPPYITVYMWKRTA